MNNELNVKYILNGIYYVFDCLDGLLSDGMYTTKSLYEAINKREGEYSEREIKNIAVDHEADLYKLTINKGKIKSSELIYSTWN